MGHLQDFESQEKGGRRMGVIRDLGGQVDKVVDSMIKLQVEYEAYRSTLDPEVEKDAEDIVYSDGAFDYSVALNKPKIDLLTVEQKVWMDRYMAGLGYVPAAK